MPDSYDRQIECALDQLGRFSLALAVQYGDQWRRTNGETNKAALLAEINAALDTERTAATKARQAAIAAAQEGSRHA